MEILFLFIFIIAYKVYIEYNTVLQSSNYGRYLYMGGTVNMEGIYIWEEL